ncbi:MAG: hypothetical protein NC395_05570 [Prevotella sp.]|nr:hypothetical protein [Prevotella sp.]
MGFIGAVFIAALVCHWSGTTVTFFVLIELAVSMMLTECLCARRNMRALEKMMKDDD